MCVSTAIKTLKVGVEKWVLVYLPFRFQHKHMIKYNPKDWFTFIFRIHRSETFRQLLPLMAGVSTYAFIVTYFELHSFFSKESIDTAKNISVIYSILGFTLSLLLVFRTNSAYDRWWEGRKQWGELTNASRALAAQLNALLDKNQQTRTLVSNYISLFAFTLQAHLKTDRISFDLIESKFKAPMLLKENIEKIASSYHQPQEVYNQLTALLHELKRHNEYRTEDMYVFKNELNKLIEVCGACERIKNTPIPFSYSVFLKKFVFFYVMLFPLTYGLTMSYFIIPATVLILYVLASLELIAEEIEDPFNGEANDLPTTEMAENIDKSVTAILLTS